MTSKLRLVRVTANQRIIEHSLDKNILGKEFFDKIATELRIKSVQYFGLQYTDQKGDIGWIKLNKKLFPQSGLKNLSDPIQMKFCIKFYPEDVIKELEGDINALVFLYSEVRSLILQREIKCPEEEMTIMKSYETDSEDPAKMLSYLQIAEKLKMYGVSYFNAKNKKGDRLYLGVTPTGLKIFQNEDMENPIKFLTWDQISNISFNDRKIVLMLTSNRETLIYFSTRLQQCKRFLARCMGYNELYARRRVI